MKTGDNMQEMKVISTAKCYQTVYEQRGGWKMEKLSIDSKCQETRNNQKQNNSFKSYQYVSLMYYTTNIWKF